MQLLLENLYKEYLEHIYNPLTNRNLSRYSVSTQITYMKNCIKLSKRLNKKLDEHRIQKIYNILTSSDLNAYNLTITEYKAFLYFMRPNSKMYNLIKYVLMYTCKNTASILLDFMNDFYYVFNEKYIIDDLFLIKLMWEHIKPQFKHTNEIESYLMDTFSYESTQLTIPTYLVQNPLLNYLRKQTFMDTNPQLREYKGLVLNPYLSFEWLVELVNTNNLHLLNIDADDNVRVLNSLAVMLYNTSFKELVKSNSKACTDVNNLILRDIILTTSFAPVEIYLYDNGVTTPDSRALVTGTDIEMRLRLLGLGKETLRKYNYLCSIGKRPKHTQLLTEFNQELCDKNMLYYKNKAYLLNFLKDYKQNRW